MGVLSAMAMGMFASCSSYVPIVLNDMRTTTPQKGEETCIDVFAVKSGNELERIKATPGDEHFRTVGKPSRPAYVWRFYPNDANAPRLLPGDHILFHIWADAEADMLVAVCKDPRFKNPLKLQQRMTTYPHNPGAYPPNTQSLILILSDDGLRFEASTKKAPKAPSYPEAPEITNT